MEKFSRTLILVTLIINLASSADNYRYKGIHINSHWTKIKTCQTALKILKDWATLPKETMIQLSNLPCTVSELQQTLTGPFVKFKPYSVTWGNGVAVTVILDDGMIQIIRLNRSVRIHRHH